MPAPFRYADLHCHPNLKTYGHSFGSQPNPRSDMWHAIPPNWYTRRIYQQTGITKFSQTDFTTMANGKARIAFVSLYPFEKGFFTNPNLWPPLVALLADWGIEIGYERIRHLQKHTNYFQDLTKEYAFICNSGKTRNVNGRKTQWVLTRNRAEVAQALEQEDTIAVVLTIEGAHVFNTGLAHYGVPYDESGILSNIEAVKQWNFPVLFVGLAHNFSNNLCGHARSLQRLGKLVNQDKDLDAGILPLGYKVIEVLLDRSRGRRIYIDLKHMSLRSRLEYYHLLQTNYSGENIPLIASHASVTGTKMDGTATSRGTANLFNTNDLNFFDEEIEAIARSGGLLALQMDINVHTEDMKLKKFLSQYTHLPPLRTSALIIWSQLQHIAEVCDRAGLDAWSTTAIGSDFDGSIKPFPGLLTAAGLEALAPELEQLAGSYLSRARFHVAANHAIEPAEIIERFMFTNAMAFLQSFYL